MQTRRAFLGLLSGAFPFLAFFKGKKKYATEAQENLVWGTYGPNACHYPNLRWKRLVDCETDHLVAILNTQHQINTEYREAIDAIMKDRCDFLV